MRHPILYLFIFFLALGLGGCAHGPPPPVEPPKTVSVPGGKNNATIYLRRENTHTMSQLEAYIDFDGKALGTITNGQCVRISIPAGKHMLTVSKLRFNPFASVGSLLSSALKLHNVDIKAGQRQYYIVKPYYSGPNAGWMYSTTKQKSGGKRC